MAPVTLSCHRERVKWGDDGRQWSRMGKDKDQHRPQFTRLILDNAGLAGEPVLPNWSLLLS